MSEILRNMCVSWRIEAVMSGKAGEAQKADIAAFGRRLSAICDEHEDVPPPNRGRLRWLSQQLAERGIQISVETARRWLSGEARPRHAKLNALAEILEVDVGWLALGVERDLRPETNGRLPQNPLVGIAAGLVQLEGGVCALPYDADQKRGIDLHVIIDGRKLDLYLPLGRLSDNTVEFSVRNDVCSTAHVIGGVLADEGEVSFFDLSDFFQRPEHGDGTVPETLTFELKEGLLRRAGQGVRRLRRFGPLTLIG